MPRNPASDAPPELLVLGGIASVQFGAAFADQLFPKAGPAGVVLLRLLLAALILLPIARPSLRGRSRGDLTAAVLFGLALGGMNWSFYEALNRLPLGVAVTVEFVGPLSLAVVMSRRLVDLLWAALAAGGVVLLATRGGHAGVHLSGVLLALLAGGFWACYILLSKRTGAAFPQLTGLSIAMVIGAVVVIPAGIVQGGSALVRPEVLGGGLGVAVLSSLIPYSLEIMALRRIAAGRFGLLMSLEPAVAALAGIVVLGESLTLVLAVALVMVVTASVGSTLAGRRETAPGVVDGEPQPGT